MKRFECLAGQRKDLVKKLEGLTGQKARYTFMPRCAYEVGAFTVEKDGVLVAADGADAEVIRALQEAGMVGEGIEEAEAAEAVGTTAEPEAAETAVERPATEPETQPTGPEADGTDAEAEPELASDTGAGQDTVDGDTDGGGAAGTDSAFPLDADISLPLTGHTAASLRNLVNLLYSKGELISKATGGRFSVSRQLAEAMQDGSGIHNADGFIGKLSERLAADGGMDGIRFESDGIHFDGFISVEDEAHLSAYAILAAKMNQMALTQKRIQMKEADMTNEKFAMRTWLVRMGMGGDGYKETRKILLEKLTGHSAFRTPEQAEAFRKKEKGKRDALRAAKMAAASDAPTEA